MTMSKDQLSVEAAKMYYQLEYSQQQIAKELEISRPTVSRLLKHAKEKGFVEIKITDPFNETLVLEDLLKEKYGLKEVVIAQSISDQEDIIISDISQKAAEFLNEVIKPGNIIGIGWGKTIFEVGKKLVPSDFKDIEVVQLKGSISHSNINTNAYETLSLFAKNYDTTGIALPLPVIFDNKEVKELVEKDRHIQHIMELQKDSSIALYTVGTTREDALLFQLGYLSSDETKSLMNNSKGDICSRFYDEQGNIASKEINDRTIGIELEELRNKEYSILVAGGERKLTAIHGALLGKYPNVLVTDFNTAKELSEI